MTAFDIIRNIFAVIGICTVFCVIAGYIAMRCDDWLGDPADEHTEVNDSRG